MEASRFDRLARAFVTTSTRRHLLALLTAMPLAGLLPRPGDETGTLARRRKGHRQHAHQQKGHTQTQRHKQRDRDAHSAACIPTGKPCPSKKPRGKKGKKLSCAHCCRGIAVPDAAGKLVCGCVPTGGSCITGTTSSCCSGFCDGSSCQAAPCSAALPCPPCQSCGADGLCAPLADGSACDDGNACTQTDTCQGGVCVGSNPVICPPAPNACQTPGTCNPATGACSAPTPKSNRTSCSDGNICCNGSCCAGCCDRDGACGACLAFVTSALQQGNLGGLSGADALCTTRAQAANPPLPGTYMAWISDDTGSPSSRFRCTQASCSAEGYRRVDDAVVADDWADLTDGSELDARITLTELHTDSLFPIVWSQTLPDGTEGGVLVDAHCNNWSTNAPFTSGIRGGTGQVNVHGDLWTRFGANSCDAFRALLCFQQS